MPEREKIKVTPEEIAKKLMNLVTKSYKQDEIFRRRLLSVVPTSIKALTTWSPFTLVCFLDWYLLGPY